MIYILLSIITAWWLIFCFKLFPKYKIQQLDAIVVNYFVCTLMSYLFTPKTSLHSQAFYSWLPYAVMLGLFFISLFNLMAYSTRMVGITVTSTANKLSLVIPVMAGYLLLNENMGFYKICGFILALLAIYFITKKHDDAEKVMDKKLIILPIILFLWNGINDSIFSVVQKKYLPESDYSFFSLVIFGISFCIGIVYLTYLKIRNKESFHIRNIWAGILLGVPNYFSIYYMLKALNNSGYTNSEVYTIVNIGIVSLSALTGYFMFHEKLSKANVIGLGLSFLAIFLISYVR